MDKSEFSKIRRLLGKSQSQLAQVLGTSTKAIQSFEQGWRNIPVHVERQMLFLLARKNTFKGDTPCWELQNCPEGKRENCPAWEFHCGDFCWFINGTICHGEVQPSWQEKMNNCQQCEVFRSMFSSLT